jgi:hypothetical protein
VGSSNSSSFGNGDWEGIEGNGGDDGIIVKYDNNGNIIWKKHFGGNYLDAFYSITDVSDGLIVVGTAFLKSFGTGHWFGFHSKGDLDSIIVKFDYEGNVDWKNNFGGKGEDIFVSATSVSGGVVVVGQSEKTEIGGYSSFGNGDWIGVAGYGESDAIIVKYDHNGNVEWKKNFGGKGYDKFESVVATSGEIVAVGFSTNDSFGNGCWEEIEGNGGMDGIIVKYDHAGNVVWKNNFGGHGFDVFQSLVTVSGGLVAVGNSDDSSFNSGDWDTIIGKGFTDATIVKYVPCQIGIYNYKSGYDIFLYPNPTKEELRIRNYESEIRNVEIFDVYGRSVLKLEIRNPKSETAINVSSLCSGIYFIRLIDEKGSSVLRIKKNKIKKPKINKKDNFEDKK